MSIPASSTAPAVPFLSVIIPFYNRFPWLERAVESLCALPCENVELLLVDDASTEAELEEALRALRARKPDLVYLRQPENDGQHNARLRGLEEATGEWVFFMDSDDALFSPEALPRLEAFLARQPQKDHVDCVLLTVCSHTIGNAGRQDLLLPETELAEREVWPADMVIDAAMHWLTHYGALWNWVYRREFLLRDPIGRMSQRFGEDGAMANHYLFRAGQIGLFRSPFYLRFLDAPDRQCNPENILRTFTDPKFFAGLGRLPENRAHAASPVKARFMTKGFINCMNACLSILEPEDFLRLPPVCLTELAAYIAPETLQQFGERYFQHEVLKAALNIFSWLLVNEPENPQPPIWLAFIAVRQNNLAEARDFIELARQRAPHDHDFHMTLGTLFLEQGFPGLARLCYENAAAGKAGQA
jgi:glycosyltransferase involved in cell wall biosynthesis